MHVWSYCHIILIAILLLVMMHGDRWYEDEKEMPLVTDPFNCLFLLTISPNMLSLFVAKCVVRLSRLSDEII